MSTPNGPYGVTRLFAPTQPGSGWWSNYASALRRSGISQTSIQAIDADAQFIVDVGVFGDGDPQCGTWPESRERSGVVMGAVQSGKTASLMAVMAKALDHGVDAIVVLAGTRTALWQQTLARLVSQLDTLENAWSRRVLIPSRAILDRDAPSLDLGTLYALQRPRVKKALQDETPIIAVVMKNVFHLERMAMALHKNIFPAAANRSGPFHLLVIDDEADDSSILDAAAEARTGVSLADTKQIPRRIADLWETRTSPGETSQDNLFATYIAYTATPQANFLQDQSNPLAPRDFAISLRTPGAEGLLAPRSPSYRDPAGVKAWYTGGDLFYRSLKSIPLCRTDDAPDEVFENALRCFLVSSAIRLWREPDRLGPAAATTHAFSSSPEAAAGFARVSSMLIHPSSAKEDHFDVAAQVLAWADGSERKEARSRLDAGERSLSVEGIRRQITGEPGKWQYWLQEFARGAQICHTELSLPAKPSIPDVSHWDDIQRLILEEVVPGTRLAVINSDDAADDRPDFEPRRAEAGWGPPPNHSTIFVSGNVMARGLTLEGLTTTLFTRQSDAPLADTQMQMQRWFGYRGAFIELCRVFLTPHQRDLFARYHEADEALRKDVLSAMNTRGGAARALTVLQGYNFAATGKIANVGGSSLWPGATPFIRHMNVPGASEEDQNGELVAATLRERGFEVVKSKDGRELGLILGEELDLLSTAALLDRLQYWDHGPGSAGPEADRWQSVANHLGLPPGDPASPLYNAPWTEGGVDLGSGSPYWIAAYLRTWAACLSRHSPGLMTTDPPYGPWSLVDLHERADSQPKFRIGLRFGRGPEASTGPLTTLGHPVRTMQREITTDGTLANTWGARGSAGQTLRRNRPSYHYPGDEYFDYFALGEKVPARTEWGSARPVGEPGLVLFHPVDRGAGPYSLALGLSIPLGGPDQVAAQPTVTSS